MTEDSMPREVAARAGDLSPHTIRMATGLASGVGDAQQEVCRALSGEVLVIGGLLGRTRLGEDDRPAPTLATRYRARFLDELGATQCARLRETIVYAPGGLGSSTVLVERAAILLGARGG